jgi:hypothetical membrane protein
MILMRENLVNIIRKSQTVIAIILFFAVFSFCWWKTGFYLSNIQLSIWGKSGLLGYLWNTIICTLAISTWINSIFYIKKSNRIKLKWLSYIMFSFVSLALFATGFFNLNWGMVHIFSAWVYFFVYPLVIFIHSHLNRKTLHYKDWKEGISISISMIVLPILSVGLFYGLAIPETIHIIFVIIWNLKIAFKLQKKIS